MSTAKLTASNAFQNICAQFRWQSISWIIPETKKYSRHMPLIACLVAANVCAQIFLFDVDYDGHDATASGIKIFTWLPELLGRKKHVYKNPVGETDELFPLGMGSIDSTSILQQNLMDCKFLAGISSLVRTARGKQIVHDMMHQNDDGTVTVIFPGIPTEPVTVSALSPLEKHQYSRAVSVDKVFHGQWLPVLEKAYGTYRVDHQGAWKSNLRFLKHVVLDMRFSSRPALEGYGASYGAADEVGAEVLNGGHTKTIEATSFELGQLGLGKGYVTARQLRSWFSRSEVEKEIMNEQDVALTTAMQTGSIVVASTEISGDAEAYHLFSGHAYAVLNYDQEKRVLTLKDPLCADIWDQTTKKARDGVEDGLFQISLADFNLLFSRLRLQTLGVNDEALK